MLLAEKNHLSIETGESFFTAVFRRVYTIIVHEKDDARALISFRSVDYTPSGYVAGGKDQTFLEFEEVDIPKTGSVKYWISNLATEYDRSIRVSCGCERKNASHRTIRNTLSGVR